MEVPPPGPQYPHPAGPNPYVQPPGQPVNGYPPAPGYGTPYYTGAPPPSVPQQQQQQAVVVVNNQQQGVLVQQVQSFVGHMVFACVVAWCCNWLFGLIAFILAVVANSTAVSDPSQARKLGQASIGLSIAGIIVTVVIIIIVVAVTVSAGASAASTSSSYYYRY